MIVLLRLEYFSFLGSSFMRRCTSSSGNGSSLNSKLISLVDEDYLSYEPWPEASDTPREFYPTRPCSYAKSLREFRLEAASCMSAVLNCSSSLSELREDPVCNVLQGDVLDDGIEGLATDLECAVWALAARGTFLEEIDDAVFTKGAHALIYCVGIAVNSLAQEAREVRQHLGY
eukprot:CAMPEP_0185578188 /NCGR_PEP_ID=MMETSP0434-20130131/12266_1 /TAXON_ID=626734 ORGANISM="Favella taraikaensis, Strain Fe Narragansett Bay" /NCGR_SAMPLE_ID=MMETSP0434 /ASSEMBLY_ACC=CAM_ASM_000379 /LENGTH=173 /DNA_ID=CAMNT_0028195941 /DNA_START=211 /DNA_END=731 /DNA_ORIENTATION=+